MMHNVAQDLHRPSERVHARGAVSTAVPPRSLLWVTYRIGLCNVDGEMGNMCTVYTSVKYGRFNCIAARAYRSIRSSVYVWKSDLRSQYGNMSSLQSFPTAPHTGRRSRSPLEHSIDRAVGSYTYIVDACPFVLCTL